MAKRKQSKKLVPKNAKVRTPRAKLTTSKRRAKSSTLKLSAAVRAQFEETRRRIKEIEARALAKLRGKDTDK
jgi:DNA-directed RNA polymerase sigma subunit (sigma70/sigma32)